MNRKEVFRRNQHSRDQFQSIVYGEQRKIIVRLCEVLESEIGKSSGNYDWQEHWGISDEEFAEVQSALWRLSLDPIAYVEEES